jgi:hypothetical protein
LSSPGADPTAKTTTASWNRNRKQRFCGDIVRKSVGYHCYGTDVEHAALANLVELARFDLAALNELDRIIRLKSNGPASG